VAYLGGPRNRRRQQLRLHDAPPGGFAPPPHALRDKKPTHEEMEKQKRAQVRQMRDLVVFSRVATVILVLAAIAVVVIVIIAIAGHR
jgi:hypothetical protein